MQKHAERAPMSRLKPFILPAILVLGFVTFFATGLHHFLSFEALTTHYGALRLYVENQLFFAALIFALSYVGAVAFSLPIASLLTLAGGALFGWLAAPLIIISATIGAALVFLAAKTVLAELLAARAGPFLKKLEAGFQDNAFQYLLALRLIPVAPFWVVNIVPALVGMRLPSYMAATALGIIPGTAVYVSVARGFDHVLRQGQTPDLSTLSDPQVILPLIALGVLALVPIIVKKWRQKQASQTTGG